MTNDTANITFSSSIPFPVLRFRLKLRRMLTMLTTSSQELRIREERFATVMREYSNIISGICFSYSSNPDDLNDLRQDIMINIWKGLDSFNGDSSLSTWIYRVALNTCVSTVRKRSKKPVTIPIDNNDLYFSDDSAIETKERIELLHSLISELSPLDKAVITMWLDERKYEEIAEVTGLTRNNVAVRINRIKQKLSLKFRVYPLKDVNDKNRLF